MVGMRSLLALSFAVSLHASVLGVSKPVEPLNVERINKVIPAAQRGAWLTYLKHSTQLNLADRASIDAERKGLATLPPLPQQSFSARTIPLHREAAFYASDEAKHIGDVILSFQTPSGGWSKNLDMAGQPRQRGQSYATANAAPTESKADDFDHPVDEHWHYIATIDNDATNTEIHYLAELSAALPGHEGDKYREAAKHGIEYLLAAQFPNGGWPQIYPLEGGYHDAITFNDDALIETVEVLAAAAKGTKQTSEPEAVDPEMAAAMQRMGRKVPEQHASTEDWSFVPAPLRARATAAVAKSLDVTLKTQVRLASAPGQPKTLTVWGQQYDPLTLEPCSARNYEMPSLSSGESAGVMEYLMSLDHPSPAVVQAVNAAATWFEAHKIMGYVFTGGRNTAGGRHLEAKEGAGPIWSRYYALDTQKPIFGDRDKTIHDDVMDISLERRNGYAWYGAGPARALAEYAAWKKSH
jgi:hypothetical protein